MQGIWGEKGGGVWAVGWQGAQDVKRSERPRPVSAGAAARNHARSYDMKPLTLNDPLDRGRRRVKQNNTQAETNVCAA